MIYSTLIDTIKAKASTIPHVAQVFMHPLGAEVIDFTTMKRVGTRIKKYPALIFSPSTFDNDFADTSTNHRTMRFNAWLIINAENIEKTDIYETVLPNAIDGVLSVFDKGWDFGTVDGHRAWARMATGSFGITPNDKGQEVWCEMQLVVRINVDAN